MSPFKMVKVFQRWVKVAKFLQIWSHWAWAITSPNRVEMVKTFEIYLHSQLNK